MLVFAPRMRDVPPVPMPQPQPPAGAVASTAPVMAPVGTTITEIDVTDPAAMRRVPSAR